MLIGGRRSCGKTTKLIKKANKERLYILCADTKRSQFITKMARDMELDIPFPITVRELPLRSPFINKVLVDDIEDVLTQIINKPILLASTSLKLKQL